MILSMKSGGPFFAHWESLQEDVIIGSTITDEI